MTQINPNQINPDSWTDNQVLKRVAWEVIFSDEAAAISDIGNNYLILTGTMAGTPPEVDITDTRITDTTPYLVFYETQPVGNITRTLTNGNLNISSDDDADAGLDVKVLFWNIWPSRQYMKGNIAIHWTSVVVTDPRITATTPAMLMPRTTPVGYVTATTWAGVMTISSTGTEVGVIVDYIVTLDTTNYSDGMPYNPTLADNHAFFRKNPTTGQDEMVEWGDMKWWIQWVWTRVMMSISKTFDEWTTTTSYTHTLGRVPQYIRMDGVWSPGSVYISLGERFTWWIQWCAYSNTNSWWVSLTAVAVISYIWWWSQIWVISNVTSTWFDITWTYSSSYTPVFSMNFLVTLQ